MTRIIAISNQKGGVGKTTTTVNLGAGLAERGQRVLLVDCDPQASLTDALGIDASSLTRSMYEVMIGTAPLADIICAAHGMYLAPATIDLEAAQVQLLSEVGRERILSDALAQVVADYDIVVLDCPPSLNVMTLNALTAADEVIIPVECHYLALRGLGYLVASIQKIQQRTNPHLTIRGVLPTMLDSRTSHGQDVLATLHEQFPGQVFTPIKRTVYFAESTVAGTSILDYRSDHAGAAEYRALAAEVLL